MMNTDLKVFALTAILVASIGITPAFGQIIDPITVTTDKASYSEGETILVTGEVANRISTFEVTLWLIAPNGNIVSVDQIPVEQDSTFSTELAAGGLIKSEGTYTINVLYGSEARTNMTTFEFSGSAEPPVMPGPDPGPGPSQTMYPVMIEESAYPLGYSITGGTLVSIVPDMDATSLMITIDAPEDGSLTITLPRSVIDALEGDMDTDYFVLVDNEEASFDETKTADDRTLTIQFPAGAEVIEIIGTWIVPEFGTIAVMVLAAAIISIVAITARSRLSIMPRY